MYERIYDIWFIQYTIKKKKHREVNPGDFLFCLTVQYFIYALLDCFVVIAGCCY